MREDVKAIEKFLTETETHLGGARIAGASRWFELCLVLLVSFGNSLVASSLLLADRLTIPHFPGYASYRSAAGLLQEVTSLLLLAYVLSRRQRRFKDIGLRWSPRDIAAGLAVAVGAYCAYAAGHYLLYWLHSVFYSSAPTGATAAEVFGHSSILGVPLILLNPFFEELIVRAYLMTEVIELTGSATLAVGTSVLLQTAYHLYYGWVGALSLSFVFLAFSVYYARTRKAAPVVIAHAVFDLAGFIDLL